MENEQNPELEQEKTETEEAPEKKELTPEQIEGIERRQLTKLAKKYGVDLPKPEAEQVKKEEKKSFDYGEKAYLKTNGVSEEDFDYLFEIANRKPIEEVLGKTWVQKDLAERKEARATKAAIPEGSERSSTSAKDSEDYWITKIRAGSANVMDIEDIALRRKVVNGMTKKGKPGSQFSSRPIA